MTAKPMGLLGGLVAVVGMASSLDAIAEGSAEQTLTYGVAAINEISVAGDPGTMTISTGEGGDDQPGRQDRKRMIAPYQDGTEQSV